MIEQHSDEISKLCVVLDIKRIHAESLLSKTGGNIERAIQMHFQGWSSSPMGSNSNINNNKKNKSPATGKSTTSKTKKSKNSSSFSSPFITESSSVIKDKDEDKDKQKKITSLMIDLSETNVDKEDEA